MLQLTWSEIRHHPTRLLGVALAIIISVGFVSGALVFVDTQGQAVRAAVTRDTAGSNVLIEPVDEKPLTTAIQGTPGVAVVETRRSVYLTLSSGIAAGEVELTSLLNDQRLRPDTLQSGHWPTDTKELAIGSSTAAALGVQLGSTVALRSEAGTLNRTVVGITEQAPSLFDQLQLTGVVAGTDPVLATGWPSYLVIAAAGTSPEDLVAALQPRLAEGTTIRTSTEVAQDRIAAITDDVDVLKIVLLAFGGIAMLVGAIIISTTFTAVVAQRRRQIGLLRAVGADRGQIRRHLLLEALVVGIVGSAIGLAVGVGIAAAGSAVVGTLGSGLVVKPAPLLLAAAVGVLVTLVGAFAPTRRAVRVSPLDALRPVADLGTERRSLLLRGLASLAVVLAGTAAVIVALRTPSEAVLLAIGGSALLAVGILFAAPIYLPPAIRLLARLLSRSHPTVRLAAANLVRNPGRAATVATALMLGVGLIVTLQVGAASVRASTEASVHSEFPVDIELSSASGTPLTQSVIDKVRTTPGVRAVTSVPSVDLDLGSQHGQVRAYGLAPDAHNVVAAGLDQLNDDTALVHGSVLGYLGLRDGQRLQLKDHGRTVSVVLRASDVAGASGGLVLTQATLDRLAPGAGVGAVWAAAEPGADVVRLMAALETVAGGQRGVTVGGSLEQIAQIDQILQTLLTGATALTAVAVVIALVGMGTTLGLSVLERSRESALLRALGLQRRQLRTMLAVEALLLAGLGAIVGVAAGVLFGAIGASAMAVQGEFVETRLALSVPQVLLVVVIALVAGALASVLPGRRAAEAMPVAALAEA